MVATKIAKRAKKSAGSFKNWDRKDENDEEEILKKTRAKKLANEKVLRSGVREALRCCGEMAAALQESWKPRRIERLADNVCCWSVQT